MNYDKMPRAKLIHHVTAYSEAIHKLANKAMKLELERNKLKHRLDQIGDMQSFFEEVRS